MDKYQIMMIQLAFIHWCLREALGTISNTSCFHFLFSLLALNVAKENFIFVISLNVLQRTVCGSLTALSGLKNYFQTCD